MSSLSRNWKGDRMSMSDCEKCWETLCECGHTYRNMSYGRRITIACAALGIKAVDLSGVHIPKKHPQADSKEKS
jgi:hypothetical protein